MPKPEGNNENEEAEAVATEATTTHEHDDDNDDDDLPEAVAEIETEAVAAAEESQAAVATHLNHNNNFASVDLIKAYILNNTASIPDSSRPHATYTTEDSESKDANLMAAHNPFSSVSTFTMHNLGSMSSLFATTTGIDDAATTAAAVASLVGAGDHPITGSNCNKLDRLRDLMEEKLPSKQHEDITMIPLVYSAGSDRQEAASPTELDKLSRALQPKSKFKGGVAEGNSSNTKKRKEKSPAVKNFIEGSTTEKDVLMGRGGRSNHHPGNARYLEAKLSIQPRYRKATKEDKTGISQELVDIVKNWGGRFLKLDDNSQRWYEVDNITARKKASQTLREENTPDSRAQKRAKYSHKGNAAGGGKKSARTSAAVTAAAVAAAGVPIVVVEDAAAVDPETTTPTITTDHTTATEHPEAYQQTDV
jgi:hypothetical protein